MKLLNRNTLLFLLLLAVLFACIPAAGENLWDCPQCGATGNTGGFCSQCGHSSPWIENAVSAGEYHYPPREANDYHTITADWFKAEIKGNQLKVTFEDNETAKERPLELTVTAGDIFHTFKFIQYAN